MVPFAGWEMPIQYSSIVSEHQACRSSAALFDVSHMGRIKFEGDHSAHLLDRLLTRQVTNLPTGRVRYALVCNEEGGVLDDVLVSNLETPSGGQFHLLVVNASNRVKIFQWIEKYVNDFPSVTVSDRTELTAMIAVQGPLAMTVCKKLFRSDPSRLKYYRSVVTDQFSKPVIVSRTGYTGEDGLELIVRAEEANRVWENILLAGRDEKFVPAGLGARDTLRLEASMPLYGHELSESIDPLSVGLGFACDLDGRTFCGDVALRNIERSGPSTTRVGLRPEGKRPAREGCAVLSEQGESIGVVTSGGPSPTLGYPIAMAQIDADYSDQDKFQVDIRGNITPAVKVAMPFYKRS